MTKANDLLQLLEKVNYTDSVHIADLEKIVASVTAALRDIKEAGSKIKDKGDLEKFNKCLMGMKGTSSKAAEIAAKALKDTMGK